MSHHRKQAAPCGLIRPAASALLLSALILASPPAFAQHRSNAVDVSWCSPIGNLTSTQRVDGCSAMLAQRKVSKATRVTAYVLRGQAYSARRDYASAIADFTAAIRLDDAYAVAWRERAGAYFASGDKPHAIADYTTSIRLDPDPSGYLGRGIIYLDADEYDLAIADFGAMIRLKPSMKIGYINRGEARRRKGQVELAIADFDQAIALDPKDSICVVRSRHCP